MAFWGNLRVVASRENEGYRTRRKFIRDCKCKFSAQVDVENDRVHPMGLDLAKSLADIGDRSKDFDAFRPQRLLDLVGDEVFVLHDEYDEAVWLLTVVHGVPDSSLRIRIVRRLGRETNIGE